jgi:hypothetical protein
MADEPESPPSFTADSSPVTTTAPSLSSRRRQGRKSSTPAAAPSPTLRQIRKQCLFNMQYHAAREAYLDGIHRWFMFLVIVLGASAIIDIAPNYPFLKIALPAASAVIGAMDLAFDLSNRARIHAVMRRRYSDILNSCLRNPDELAVADANLIELAGEEEPAFHALIAVCHNAAETQVYGDDVEHLKVPLHHRIFQNVLRFEGAQYEMKHQPK